MNNLFRVIFGLPPDDPQGPRMGDDMPNAWGNNFRGNLGGNNDDDDDYDNNELNDNDNMGIHPGRGGRGGGMNFFGFPIFSDPIEIHKYFESVMEDMHKKFEVFGFHNEPSIIWEDGKEGSSSNYFNEEPTNEYGSLRDSFLKSPGYINEKVTQKQDVDLDGQIKAEDLDNFLRSEPGSSRDVLLQKSSPQVYAKSVFIRTIKRPDGTVETVKKIRDNTGKEETTTTITQGEDFKVSPDNQLTQGDDAAGFSIFKKFFPF